MKSIAILLPDLRGGGAEKVCLDLATEFKSRGHRVEFVLVRECGELLVEAQREFAVVSLDCDRVRHVPLALVRYLRKRHPDVLLAAMWPLTVVAPITRLCGYRGRVVVSEHNSLSVQYQHQGRLHHWALRLSMNLGYRLAHGRVSVSSGVGDDIAALSKLPRACFHTIYNPVSPRPAADETAMRSADQLWAGPRGARVLTVGSMKAQKNQPLLLRAFARLQQPDARLMFVGAGAGEAYLRTLAVELDIADRVIFAGFQSNPTPFYATADLFALSSNYEGFGNVIVEAMGCGVPVVTTESPGPAEILEHGQFGDLVPVGDEEALALAINKALANPRSRGMLKRRAEDFAPAIAATRYLELMKGAV